MAGAGLLKEKLVQLIKTLPQKIRAKLVPVPEFVDRVHRRGRPATTKDEPGLIRR